MILAVIVYFALATVVLALLFLPGARAVVWQRAQRLVAGGRAASRSIGAAGQRGASGVSQSVGGTAQRALLWLRAHAPWVAAALLLLLAAPLVPLFLRDRIELDGYDHTASREVNEHVAALLQGEQLVPPAPLPPELFTTREVEQARPLIREASRQWDLLDQAFEQRLLLVFKLMRERHGYEMVLLEGYRSPQRQARLAALGGHVTKAGAYESYHQYGLAADCAFLRGGKIVISERDPWAMRGYELYGETAREVGLTWGGAWRTIKDYGHVEMRRPGVLKRRNNSEESGAAHVH
jgi:peptidoglycan LD-endopeptidase CwlK